MGFIYLVRHGQASFGHDDYDNLSPLGHQQSQRLGQYFAQCGRIWSQAWRGDLKRHEQTGRGTLDACEHEQLPLRVHNGFTEFNHRQVLFSHKPEFEDKTAAMSFLAQSGNPYKAFQKIFAEAMMRWMIGAQDQDYDESWEQFKVRCVAAVQDVVEQADEDMNIVVFSSGGPISAIAQHILDLDIKRTLDLQWVIANTSVSRLRFSKARWWLDSLNSYSHLEHDGDKSMVSYR